MGEVRELISEAIADGMRPFGVIEVGGAVFGQLMDELAAETHQVSTSMSKDLVVNVVLPDGTVVYLNPTLHPGAIVIENVQGRA